MKLEKITIENFRVYKDTHTIDLSNLNVFVGKNDVGKSTILEALDIFFNEKDAAIKIDEQDKNKDSNDEVMISVCFSDYPDYIDLDAGNKTTLKDEYLLNREGYLEIRKKYTGKTMKVSTFIYAHHPTYDMGKELLLKKQTELKQIVEDNDYQCEDKKVNAKLRKAIWDNCDDLALQEIEISIDKEDAKQLWEKLQIHLPIYALFQSDRANKDSDTEVQDPMKLTIKEVLANEELQNTLNGIADEVINKVGEVTRQTLEKLKEMNPEIANDLKAVFPETKSLKWADVFKGFTINSDKDIPLNKRGSGVKRLILLNFFRASAERKQKENNAKNAIYAIEEPETSQHLEHQDMLIKALKKLSRTTQILLTTHSTQIVKSIFSKDNTLEANTKCFIIRNNENNVEVKGVHEKGTCLSLPYVSANEINYVAFEAYTEEYHTELYSHLEKEHKDIFNESISKSEQQPQEGYLEYTNEKSGKTEYITPHKYIRNQIHHPENIKNERYTESQLKESIVFMQELILSKSC